MRVQHYTIDVEQGDGRVFSKEEAIYLACKHAEEATRLTNEAADVLSNRIFRPSDELALRMAQVHSQNACAYAAIANAKGWTDPIT